MEPHEVKKKSFDLNRNQTHDLRIRSTVTVTVTGPGREILDSDQRVLFQNSPCYKDYVGRKFIKAETRQ